MKLKYVLIVLMMTFAFGCKSESGTISQVDLKAKISSAESSFVLLDVRSDVEFSRGHIQGAVHIPHTQINSMSDKLDKDKDIIVYCQSGYRAKKAIKSLEKLGFTKVFHLQGDWAAWSAN